MRRTRSSIPTQIPLFPPAGAARQVELTAPQQQELIRAVAELLLRAAADARATAHGGGWPAFTLELPAELRSDLDALTARARAGTSPTPSTRTTCQESVCAIP
jgi:hypothetical protein